MSWTSDLLFCKKYFNLFVFGLLMMSMIINMVQFVWYVTQCGKWKEVLCKTLNKIKANSSSSLHLVLTNNIKKKVINLSYNNEFRNCSVINFHPRSSSSKGALKFAWSEKHFPVSIIMLSKINYQRSCLVSTLQLENTDYNQ